MEKYVKINDVIDQLANELGCVDAVTRGMLYALPDADVAPVRHARWDNSGRYTFLIGSKAVVCTGCGYALTTSEYQLNWWNYCPVCGARMDGGAGE